MYHVAIGKYTQFEQDSDPRHLCIIPLVMWWLVVGPGLTPPTEIEHPASAVQCLVKFTLGVIRPCKYGLLLQQDAQLILDALGSPGKKVLIMLDTDQIIEALKL